MFRRCTVAALLVALVFPVAAQPPGGTIIRCESGLFGSFKRCPRRSRRPRHAHPRALVQQVLGGPDRAWTATASGSTTGARRTSAWAATGAGEGDLGLAPRGYDDDRYRDRGIGTGTAIAVGAVTAAVIVGAILATRDKHPVGGGGGRRPRLGGGRFSGYSPKTDCYIDITIAKAGGVSGSLDEDAFIGTVSNDGRLRLGDVVFTMKRQSWGFVATRSTTPKTSSRSAGSS